MATHFQLCPDFAGFLCRPWPDEFDDSYPPVALFRLSELAPPVAHTIFKESLRSTVKIGEDLFVADATFWKSIHSAQLQCKLAGINSLNVFSQSQFSCIDIF